MVPVTFSSVLFRIGTKDVFNVIYAEFTVCDNTVWEFIGAVKSLTGDLFPGNLIAREVIVSISELGRLVSLAEIEVCPLSFNCRFVLSVLDGYFSNGRTYTIADPNEVWQLAIHQGNKWVARRVKDNEVVYIPNNFMMNKVDVTILMASLALVARSAIILRMP